MLANPVYTDVEGAPFNIGQQVVVVGSEDQTFDCASEGRDGIVEYFEYDCGCGQTHPGDPMIGVVFRDGTREEFWKEELGPCDPRSAIEKCCNQRNR